MAKWHEGNRPFTLNSIVFLLPFHLSPQFALKGTLLSDSPYALGHSLMDSYKGLRLFKGGLQDNI